MPILYACGNSLDKLFVCGWVLVGYSDYELTQCARDIQDDDRVDGRYLGRFTQIKVDTSKNAH